MILGIDVGGTFTDAALLDGGLVRATAKVPTSEDLLGSIIEAIDLIFKGVENRKLERIVFSTTIITNLIAERKYDRAALLLLPGPGLKSDLEDIDAEAYILSGAIDYRGREIIPLNESEIESALIGIAFKGYKKVGIIGKFSTRNTSHEKLVAKIVREKYPDWQIEIGSRIGSKLNYPRRINTTYLTCVTREPYKRFVESVSLAMEKRSIQADVFVLKADGGTIALENSKEMPVETIFSGPAASTLGAQALTSPGETAVVVDIGGTTTDLALILDGQPLLSAKGAKLGSLLTQVRTMAVRSVPVGGDSVLEVENRNVVIRPRRMGPAYCMEGPVPTPTDALRLLGLTSLGNKARASEGMSMLAKQLNITAEDTAKRVVQLVVEKIVNEINKIFFEWEQEPAYRVWEILQKKKIRPSTVIGVGGGAQGFIKYIADKMNCKPFVPYYAPVANAIGTAVAKPTLQVSLRADTEQGYYIIQEEAYQGNLDKGNFYEEEAIMLAKSNLLERAYKYGIVIDAEEIEITHREVFNMIRGWSTTGRLFDVVVQTPRGITNRIYTEGVDK